MTDFISTSVRVLLDTGWEVDFPRRLEHSVNNSFPDMSPWVLMAFLIDRSVRCYHLRV